MVWLRILCILFIISIASGMQLNMKGLPDNSCVKIDIVNQVCNYSFGDSALLNILPLECVLNSTNKNDDYEIKFETDKKIVRKHDVPKTVSYSILLEAYNKSVKCTADEVDGNQMTIEVNVYYIPPASTSTSSSTTTTTTTTEPPTRDDSRTRWLKWLLGGGALLITICVVVECIVMHRQKKPPPADSTYANLTEDQNKNMPMRAPRSIHKPNVAQKPNAASKPNVTLDNNSSEPKDSQDMSEALYADPNRFVGDSRNYAEPYVAKPSPQSDMYAEPYKSNYAEPYSSTSEGHYAELDLPDNTGKELYAKPIPKAQRKPKVKDDCIYSTVFVAQYGNTRK